MEQFEIEEMLRRRGHTRYTFMAKFLLSCRELRRESERRREFPSISNSSIGRRSIYHRPLCHCLISGCLITVEIMYLLIVFLPLLGSSVAGFFGRFLGSEGTAIITTGRNLVLFCNTHFFLDLSFSSFILFVGIKSLAFHLYLCIYPFIFSSFSFSSTLFERCFLFCFYCGCGDRHHCRDRIR